MDKCGFKLVDIKNPDDIYEASYILEKQISFDNIS